MVSSPEVVLNLDFTLILGGVLDNGEQLFTLSLVLLGVGIGTCILARCS